MNVRLLVMALVLGGFIAWGVLHRDKTASRISGTIEADDARLASRYGGRVEQLLADEGATLTNGQRVARLAAPELAARRSAFAAQLDELVSGPRSQTILAAQKEWESLAARLENAINDARRAQELFAIGATSDSERDAASARARALESQVAAAKSRYDELVAGTRPEQIERLRAQLRELDTQIAELDVVAPASCSLEMLHVKPGDVVAPGGPIATVIYPTNLWLRVYVPETWLARLSVGGGVTLRVDGYPDQDFAGAIEQISRRAEFTPRNVQTITERMKQVFGVKIRVADAAKLRAGMATDVIFADAPR